MNIDLLIQPQGPVLQRYFDSRARVQLIRGPLGSGKTTQSVLKIFDFMCCQKPTSDGIRLTRFFAVRNTYPDLFNSTVKDWIEAFGELGNFNKGGKSPPTHYLDFRLDDGTQVKSEMIFLAFDKPEHVKKARGTQVTGIWLNEVKELNKAVVDILDLRHGRYPSHKEGATPTWHGMIGDYNSPDDDHWLYEMAEVERPAGWEFFVQPGGLMKDDAGKWVLNPDAENLSNLPKDYYVAGMQGKAEDWIKVNLANEYGFVQYGRPVQPFYSDSVHCRSIDFTPSREQAIILGFDFGRTPACAFVQSVPGGGWICFDEFLSYDISASAFAPELAKYLNRNYGGHQFRGWGDPSGGHGNQSTDDTPIRILRDNGINCRPTISNNPVYRRSAVEQPLREVSMNGNPRLIILPKARKIRKGLAGGFCYRRIHVSDERYTEEPDKNEYSHPCEALEYALYGEGEGRFIKRDERDKYSNWDIAVNE